MKKKLVCMCISSLFIIALFAHPHFTKTVVAEMKGGVMTLRFTTYPYNEAHLSQVQEGFVFHCGRAVVKLSANVGSGGERVPAGEYSLRAQAKSLDDWTLILVPAAQAGSSSEIDVSKGIRLESSTRADQCFSHHLALDLHSGHGETDGKLLLSVAFGGRTIEAALTVN